MNILEPKEGDHPSWQKAADIAREAGATVGLKSESRLQRLIGRLLFFNKSYMTGFITTIGRGVWVPDSWADRPRTKGDSGVLLHEVAHVHQYERLPSCLFSIGYLFPQVLAPLALLSILAWPLSNLWLLNLLWLVCAAPLPAPFRAMWEAEAYAVSYLMSFWVLGEELPLPALTAEQVDSGMNVSRHHVLERALGNFTGWSYYRMWPWRRGVSVWISAHLRAAADGEWRQTNPVVERAHRAFLGNP